MRVIHIHSVRKDYSTAIARSLSLGRMTSCPRATPSWPSHLLSGPSSQHYGWSFQQQGLGVHGYLTIADRDCSAASSRSCRGCWRGSFHRRKGEHREACSACPKQQDQLQEEQAGNTPYDPWQLQYMVMCLWAVTLKSPEEQHYSRESCRRSDRS